jgi:hypothetical protein
MQKNVKRGEEKAETTQMKHGKWQIEKIAEQK